jgi:hypothetical protein
MDTRLLWTLVCHGHVCVPPSIVYAVGSVAVCEHLALLPAALVMQLPCYSTLSMACADIITLVALVLTLSLISQNSSSLPVPTSRVQSRPEWF